MIPVITTSRRQQFCLIASIFGLLMMVAGGVAAPGEDTPVAAVERALQGLMDGKVELQNNPAFVLSPFCPKEKTKIYNNGLEALAGELALSADLRVEEGVAPRQVFAGCRVILPKRKNPLEIRVLPVCVLRTEEGWKVAAGLEHFDNTNFGYDPGLGHLAGEVVTATRQSAEEIQSRILKEAADTLLKEVRARREAWPKDESPDLMVDRYLGFDHARDLVGKLACYKLPADISPEILRGFLSELEEDTLAGQGNSDDNLDHMIHQPGKVAGDGEATEVKPDFVTVFLEEKQIGGQVCRAYGLLSASDPADSFPLGFYFGRDGDGRWALLSEETSFEGMPVAKSGLISWFSDNEDTFAKQMVEKFIERARLTNPAPAGRNDGEKVVFLYLDALRRRDIPAALALLDLPEKALVEDYDGLLEQIGKRSISLASAKDTAAVITPLHWIDAEKYGGAVCAVFKPSAVYPFVCEICTTRWTPAGWRVIPPVWEGYPPSMDIPVEARKVDIDLKDSWNDEKKSAILKLFDHPRPVMEADRSTTDAVRALADKLIAEAYASKFITIFDYWEKPEADQDPFRVVKDITQLCMKIHRASKPPVIEAVEIRGCLAGITFPVDQAIREDGQKPVRMLVARRHAGGWQMVPGLEIFRPINRGFTELNNRMLKEFSPRFDATTQNDLAALMAALGEPATDKP